MPRVTHYPRLDTIMMVEETIKKLNYPRKTEVWKALPKKIMYQTFSLIINYLQESGKILIDKDGRIIWIWNPDKVKEILSSGVKPQ